MSSTIVKLNSCTVGIHQPEALPWLGFMDKLGSCDIFVLLDNVQFEKNYFQNRNRIRAPTPDGWSWLTIPIMTKGRFAQHIGDVETNNSFDWRRKHLAALKQNYSSAPCFKSYLPILQDIYEKSWHRLIDFNVEIIRWLANAFEINTTIVYSSQLGVQGKSSALLLGICKKLGATIYLSGVSGRDYLEHDLFEAAGIEVRFQEFYHPIYRQCYEPFVPCMSSVDLLFNYGSESQRVLFDQNTPRLNQVFI